MDEDAPTRTLDRPSHAGRNQVAGNTAIAAIGTAAAVGAVTGLILPALVGAAVGGVIGYATAPHQPATQRD